MVIDSRSKLPRKTAPKGPTALRKPSGVRASVQKWLGTLKLDDAGQALASIALALAGKLDAAELSTSGAVAVAAAGLARELRATLADLAALQGEDDELIARLFGEKSS